MNSFFSKIGYSAIYVYIEFFIGLVASVLIARTLGSEDFGVYSYLIRVSTILLVVVNGGVNTGVLRFLAEYTFKFDDKKIVTFNVYKFFSKIQFWKCVVIFLFFYFVLHRFFGVVVESSYDGLILLFLVGVGFKAYYMFRVGALKGLERFDQLAWMVLAVCPVYLLLVLVGAVNEEGLVYFAAVYVFTSFLFWLISYFIIRKFLQKGSVKLENNFESRAGNYVKVVTVNTVLAALVIGYVEIYYLQLFHPIQDVGFFNIGLTIAAAAVNLVPGVYNSMLMPAIVKSTMDSDGLNTNKSKRFLFDTIRHMLILTLLVSIPAAFYAQEIIALLYSSDFLPAVYPLKMMLYASIATAFTYPAVAYFVSKDRQFDMMKIHVAVLLCSLIWSYFLVKNNGLEGAVLSYVITTVVTAGCLLLLLFRDFKAIDRPLMLIKAFFASGISIYLVSFIDLGVPSIIAIIIGSSVYAVLFITMLWKLEILTEYERSSIINLVSRRDT